MADRAAQFLAASIPCHWPPISASESGEGNGAYVHPPKQSSIGQNGPLKESPPIKPILTNNHTHLQRIQIHKTQRKQTYSVFVTGSREVQFSVIFNLFQQQREARWPTTRQLLLKQEVGSRSRTYTISKFDGAKLSDKSFKCRRHISSRGTIQVNVVEWRTLWYKMQALWHCTCSSQQPNQAT